MWAQGEQVEAIRWLKKAADGAEEAGNDMRAVMLAKAAAELRNYVEVNVGPLSQVPPAVSVPAEPPAGAAPSSEGPRSSPSSASPQAASSVRPVGAMPPPPQPKTDKRQLPPPRSSQGGEPPTSVPSPPSVPAPTTPRSEAPLSSPDDEQRMTLLASPQRFLPKAGKPGERSEVDRQDAVRVLLQPVEGKPGVLLVRPMRPGDKPAPGTRAALLVSVDGQALFE